MLSQFYIHTLHFVPPDHPTSASIMVQLTALSLSQWIDTQGQYW